jgi:hypothetical protein
MGLGIDRLLRGALIGTIALGAACAANSAQAPRPPARPEPRIDPDVAECATYQVALQRALNEHEGAIDVRNAFGTIDRSVEAVWVVDAAGHHPIQHDCLTKVVSKTAGGFSVSATCIVPSGPRCDDGRYVMSTCVFIVRPDGSFESVSVTHPNPVEACVSDDGV